MFQDDTKIGELDVKIFWDMIEIEEESILILNSQYQPIVVNNLAIELFETMNNEIQYLQVIPQVKSTLPEHPTVILPKVQSDNKRFQEDTWIITLNGKLKRVEVKVFHTNDDKIIMKLRELDVENKDITASKSSLPIEMFISIFQNAADGIVLFNKEGKIQQVNFAILELFQSEEKDLIGQNICDFVPDTPHYNHNGVFQKILDGERVQGELPLNVATGMIMSEFSISPNVYEGLHLGIIRNITEKKQMELKLKRSEELFIELFDEAIDGIIMWGKDGRVMKANHSALRIFECNLEDIQKKRIEDFVYPTSLKKYQSLMKNLHHQGAVREELLFLMPNSQLKQLEFTVKHHSIDGYHMMIVRNVSERYYIEQELRKSEERFRKIFEGTLDGLLISDHNMKIVDINPAACDIFHVTKDRLIGKDVRNLVNDLKNYEQEVSKYIQELKEEGKTQFVFKYKDEKGNHRYIEISSKYKVLSNLNLTIIRDITESKELQDQLRKSDTLSVVGELAAGIAHEIRNPMTALKGFIQLLENSIKEKHSMYFNVIKSELQRIETIITEFLILAKPQAIAYQQSSLRKIMYETVELLNAQALMHNIMINIEGDEEIPPIFAEPNQLKQVFINIIKNAIEVMPKGGSITIHFIEEEDFIHISIKDEGEGIPKEKISKLGEPFYTTKERGTGLGLMVSFKIIKEHNGHVTVDSEPDVGTTFHIYLPKKER
ncbi:PAS domain S-box protein [Bacillus spongiae]|uniref:histidine kinase n=1 Tax=Bacillus spongiae TaxID=2683610 RepID=A0ABU8H9C8_9BACI